MSQVSKTSAAVGLWFGLVGFAVCCGHAPTASSTGAVTVSSGWSVQELVPPGVLHWPMSLAFDRFGAVWVVDKVGQKSRLVRLTANLSEARWLRHEVVPVALDQLEAVTVWGDSLYLAGQGQLVRYRLLTTGELGQPAVILRGLPSGSVYLSATPHGLWLGVKNERSDNAQPGQGAVNLPHGASAWLVLRHGEEKPRLLTWEPAQWCGPVTPDMDGRVHWLAWRPMGRTVRVTWNPHTGLVESMENIAAGISPWAQQSGTSPISNGGTFPGWGLTSTVGYPPSLVGPVWEYAETPDRAQQTTCLWTGVWPAQIFAQTVENPPGKPSIRAAAAAQSSAGLWITALANGPDGGVYVAGHYRSAAAEATGFLWRLQPHAPEAVMRYSGWQELARMDASALVERLASSNAWEVRAVQEEICRRGRDLVPTLLALAQRQSSQAPQASEEAVLRQRRAAILALELAGMLDAPAARETAIAWARSGSPPLVLASLTVLGRLSDDDTRTLLVGLLADSNEQVRCAAAQALGERGGGPAAADLVQALRFYEGHHPAELLALVRAVENCGTEGLTALAELFDSGAAGDLQVALQSWTQLRHPEALRYIGKLLHHPHLANDQRQRVLRWWADLAAHYPGDGKPILDWLASHPSLPTPLLTEALRALSVASCDQTQLGPIAESYLTHDSPEVRVFALACLRGTPQRSASDKLLAMLRHNARSSQERLQAAETLLRWQNPDAIPALLALLDDESASAALREGAAALLMRYGSPAVREMVFRQLQRWPAEMLRDLVHSLRPQKQALLLLADACHCNKLPYDKCGDYLLEALAAWATGSPEAYDAFVRLQHRRTDRNKERP